MVVNMMITAPNGPFSVFKLSTSEAPTTVGKTPVTLQANTLIACEDSDIMYGTATYLRAFALFMIAKTPDGSPSDGSYYYSTGNHVVAPAPLQQSNPLTGTYTVINNTSCKLVMLSAQGAAITGSVTIQGSTSIVANVADVLVNTEGGQTTYQLKEKAIFLVNSAPGGPQGPYAFTDNQIPLNVLEDDVEIPRT